MTQQQQEALDKLRREVADGDALYCHPIKRAILRRLLELLEEKK